MSFLFLDGKINVKTYEQKCRENGLDPKKVVFIFPGNQSHHQKGTTLYSIKTGMGLAQVAKSLGEQGYPVLSLPTTTMESWDTDKGQQEIVNKAICDLWQAFGAGYSFILPVREHVATKNREPGKTYYFAEGMMFDIYVEPNFWGGVQTQPNLPLARYYIKALNDLTFRNRSESKLCDQEAVIQANVYDNRRYEAYNNGKKMAQNNDPWLQPVVAQTSQESIPASYQALYFSSPEALQGARALLNDYTKGNSALSRFFHGHWNRHHVAAVSQIVKAIDEQQITTPEGLMQKLDEIQLVNPKGSLAKRIHFLKNEFAKEEPSEQPSPNM